MQKAILQVPMDRQLKESAEKAASKQGFSSLQEMIRVFLSRLAENRVEVTIQEVAGLSDKSEKRYLKITDDFRKGKNIYSAQHLNDLTAQLK